MKRYAVRSLLLIALLCAGISAWAYDDVAKRVIYNTYQLKGEADVQIEENGYTRIILPDSVTLEVFKGDSIVVVMTACAPQCSSCARVFNKEWKEVRTLTPPFVSIFPLATIDPKTGVVVWTDNDNWEY